MSPYKDPQAKRDREAWRRLQPGYSERANAWKNAYKKTDKGKAARARYDASRSESTRVKARKAVSDAIASGKLIRPETCSECGCTCKPEGHHTDYDKPLEVVWLCTSCHRAAHRSLERSS